MNSILMGDLGADIIIALAMVSALISFSVVVRYWGFTVPVGPLAFLAMGIGCLLIGSMYLFIRLTPGPVYHITIPSSRFLWTFVLVSTLIMSATAFWFENHKPPKPPTED